MSRKKRARPVCPNCGAPHLQYYCSFCDRPASEVELLLDGGRAFICSACVRALSTPPRLLANAEPEKQAQPNMTHGPSQGKPTRPSADPCYRDAVSDDPMLAALARVEASHARPEAGHASVRVDFLDRCDRVVGGERVAARWSGC
jgi:ClpX C4-type zinc finger